MLGIDGTVWAWGDNEYGLLGDGTTTKRTYPVRVLGLTDAVAIIPNGIRTLAITRDEPPRGRPGARESVAVQRSAPRQPGSGGCYVATAVYGNYDCPQVCVLRRWRDATLTPTSAGRAFVRLYYAISPHLVDTIGTKSWFLRLARWPLDRFVARLVRGGISDTPYHGL